MGEAGLRVQDKKGHLEHICCTHRLGIIFEVPKLHLIEHLRLVTLPHGIQRSLH